MRDPRVAVPTPRGAPAALAFLVLVTGAIVAWLATRGSDPAGSAQRPATLEARSASEPVARPIALAPPPVVDAPSTEAERSEREGHTPIERTPTGFEIVVRSPEGLPIADAKVELSGSTFGQFWTEADGVLRLDARPGEYELRVTKALDAPYVPLFTPDGRSNARARLAEGEVARVELLLYRGGSVELTFVSPDDESPRVFTAEFWRFEPEVEGAELEPIAPPEIVPFQVPAPDPEWVLERQLRTREPRLLVDGLPPGRYAIVPDDEPVLCFDPFLLDLDHDQAVSRSIQTYRRTGLRVPVVVRRGSLGPALPIRVAGYLVPRVRREVALQRPFGAYTFEASEAGFLTGGNIFPSEYDLRLTAGSTIEGHAQIMRNWEWIGRLRLAAGGGTEPVEIEIVEPTIGELAIVDGQLEPFDREKRLNLAIAYEHEGFGSHRIKLTPNQDDGSFRLVIDLSPVLDREIEAVQRVGVSRWQSLSSLTLEPGEQVWRVPAPR